MSLNTNIILNNYNKNLNLNQYIYFKLKLIKLNKKCRMSRRFLFSTPLIKIVIILTEINIKNL